MEPSAGDLEEPQPCPRCGGDTQAEVVDAEDFAYSKFYCKRCEIKWTRLNDPISKNRYVKPK